MIPIFHMGVNNISNVAIANVGNKQEWHKSLNLGLMQSRNKIFLIVKNKYLDMALSLYFQANVACFLLHIVHFLINCPVAVRLRLIMEQKASSQRFALGTLTHNATKNVFWDTANP